MQGADPRTLDSMQDGEPRTEPTLLRMLHASTLQVPVENDRGPRAPPPQWGPRSPTRTNKHLSHRSGTSFTGVKSALLSAILGVTKREEQEGEMTTVEDGKKKGRAHEVEGTSSLRTGSKSWGLLR